MNTRKIKRTLPDHDIYETVQDENGVYVPIRPERKKSGLKTKPKPKTKPQQNIPAIPDQIPKPAKEFLEGIFIGLGVINQIKRFIK